jgi:hypothetical protein
MAIKVSFFSLMRRTYMPATIAASPNPAFILKGKTTGKTTIN